MGTKIFNGDYSDFKQLPYEDRKFILFEDDVKIIKYIKKSKQDSKLIDLDSIDWKKMFFFSPFMFFWPFATVWAGALYLIYELIKSNISVNTIIIKNSLASNFELPFGHPQKKVIYAGHPFNNKIYYTFANFHKDLVNSQIIEASNLLTALGATEIELLIEIGQQQNVGGDIETGIFDEDVTAKFRKTRDEKGNRTKITEISPKSFFGFEAHKVDDLHYKVGMKDTFKKSDKKPYIPDNLIWYHQNTLWQHVVKQRLENGLIKLQLSIETENDYGISGDLYTKLEKIGFNLGGKFKILKNSKLIMVASFE